MIRLSLNQGVALGWGLIALLSAGTASAADLYAKGEWPALASDRQANQVGDSLTVLIFETATATNTTQSGTDRQTRLAGQVSGGPSFNESGQLSLNGAFDGRGQTGRSGRIVAQISVVVDEVLPNGDLHVSGEQFLNINGERTRLKLKGRVRRADISAANAVVSTRLADVVIDYDGSGFTSRSAKPGILNRIFNMLGLL